MVDSDSERPARNKWVVFIGLGLLLVLIGGAVLTLSGALTAAGDPGPLVSVPDGGAGAGAGAPQAP